MKKRLVSMALCAAMTASVFATAAYAADSKAEAAEIDMSQFDGDITIICPVKAGGDTDRNTRYLAEAMQKIVGVNVVVKNVDGGATVMGMQEALDAKQDGNTLIVNGTDMFVPYMQGTSEINIDSFKTVGIPLIDNTTVLAVNKASGWNTLEELLEASKAAPDSIEYGGKIGAANQICGIAMNKEWEAGLRFVDVGNNAAKMTALLGEQTDVINISYSLANDYFTTGEFIPLVLLGTEKNELLPLDVPVASDLGLTNVDFSKFFWVGTGPDVPDEKVAALTAVLQKVTEDPEFVASVEANFLTVNFMGGEDAQAYANKMYEETLLPYKDEFLAQQ
ncbi:MAG: tripartite tricarboxylate transporter substrate-binding protein [Lachnospiraceae bacterium]|nr:tripartite tricarboxylate transporter substrate-binding protein [Lachnospiraceae bacterium]